MLLEPCSYDKDILIEGPIELVVDYDDVDHEFVLAVAKKIVEVLNKYYDAP